MESLIAKQTKHIQKCMRKIDEKCKINNNLHMYILANEKLKNTISLLESWNNEWADINFKIANKMTYTIPSPEHFVELIVGIIVYFGVLASLNMLGDDDTLYTNYKKYIQETIQSIERKSKRWFLIVPDNINEFADVIFKWCLYYKIAISE